MFSRMDFGFHIPGVTISRDVLQHQSPGAPLMAIDVTAVADTGAQSNVWSLHQFLNCGFQLADLIPAPDLSAANSSIILIAGASFAVIQEKSPNGTTIPCRAMISVSEDVQSYMQGWKSIVKK